MTQRFATVQECANHLGISRQRVHQLIQKGKLGNCKSVDSLRGKVWLVPYPFERQPSKQVGKYSWEITDVKRRIQKGGDGQ